MLKDNGILLKSNVTFSQGLVDPPLYKSEWCKNFVPQTLKERVQTLKDIWMDLLEVIEDPQFLLQAHKSLFGLCDAKVADSFIIGPDGSLYNCYSLIGCNKGNLGNIIDGLNSKYAEYLYSADKKIDKCLEEKCPFVPLCTGGCFYQAYVETGDPFLRACPKDFYRNIWLPIKVSIFERILEKGKVTSAKL